MNVKELIEKLKQVDENLPVMVRAYESDLNTVTNVNQIRVIDEWEDWRPDSTGSYNGQYKNIDFVGDAEGTKQYVEDKLQEAKNNNQQVINAVYLWSINDGVYTQ
jgi:hypothetical protein